MAAVSERFALADEAGVRIVVDDFSDAIVLLPLMLNPWAKYAGAC